MPRRTGYPEGAVCWTDLVTVDPTGAKEFYGAVLGWEFVREDDRGYHLILTGGEIVGGLGPSPAGPRFGSSWQIYLAAGDLDAALSRARSGGARILLPAVPAGANGRLALAADPQGAVFGLWEGARAEGVVLTGEPGTMCDSVLRSSGAAESAAFYRRLFPGAGAPAVQESEGEPARWVTCLGAADPDTLQQRFVSAGARLLAPGLLADPWGAVLGVTRVSPVAASPAGPRIPSPPHQGDAPA